MNPDRFEELVERTHSIGAWARLTKYVAPFLLALVLGEGAGLLVEGQHSRDAEQQLTASIARIEHANENTEKHVHDVEKEFDTQTQHEKPQVEVHIAGFCACRNATQVELCRPRPTCDSKALELCSETFKGFTCSPSQ